MCSRQSRKSQQCTTGRYSGFLNESTKFLLCIAQLNTLSYQYQWTFSAIDQFSSLAHSLFIHFGNRLVTTDVIQLGRSIFTFLYLCILGKVQYNRTGTTAFCNIESAGYSPRHIFGTTYLIAPLRDRLRNTYQVNFLESIRPKESRTYLTGNYYQRGTVYHSICDTRYRIRRSGTTRHQANTYFA